MIALHSEHWTFLHDGVVADRAVLLALGWNGLHVLLLGCGVYLYFQVPALAATLLAALHDARDELFAEASCASRLSYDLY